MLTNVESADELRGLARAKGRNYITKTVHPADVAELLDQGWAIDRQSKKSVRIKTIKSPDVLLVLQRQLPGK